MELLRTNESVILLYSIHVFRSVRCLWVNHCRDTPVESHDATTMWHIWWGYPLSVPSKLSRWTHGSPPLLTKEDYRIHRHAEIHGPHPQCQLLQRTAKDVVSFSRLDETKVIQSYPPWNSDSTWKCDAWKTIYFFWGRTIFRGYVSCRESNWYTNL